MPVPTPITSPTTSNGTLNTQAGSAVDATFLGRVAMALATVAPLVLAEDPTAYATPLTLDMARKKLAYLVLTNPMPYASQSIAYVVLGDLTTTASSTDNDLLARVVAIWSTLATPYL